MPYFEPVSINLVSTNVVSRLQRGLEVNNTLREGVKLRDLYGSKEERVELVTEVTDENDILGFDRVLGHKIDLPGSGQWR